MFKQTLDCIRIRSLGHFQSCVIRRPHFGTVCSALNVSRPSNEAQSICWFLIDFSWCAIKTLEILLFSSSFRRCVESLTIFVLEILMLMTSEKEKYFSFSQSNKWQHNVLIFLMTGSCRWWIKMTLFQLFTDTPQSHRMNFGVMDFTWSSLIDDRQNYGKMIIKWVLMSCVTFSHFAATLWSIREREKKLTRNDKYLHFITKTHHEHNVYNRKIKDTIGQRTANDERQTANGSPK